MLSQRTLSKNNPVHQSIPYRSKSSHAAISTVPCRHGCGTTPTGQDWGKLSTLLQELFSSTVQSG